MMLITLAPIFLLFWLTPAFAFEYALDPNEAVREVFPGLAEDVSLEFVEVTPGMKITMNTLIVMPAAIGLGGGKLVIHFPHSALKENFIQKFFVNPDKNFIQRHAFGNENIQLALTIDGLDLYISDGVILNLRWDGFEAPDYKTFISEEVSGKVVRVEGKVYASIEQSRIKEWLRDFYVDWLIAVIPGAPGTKIEHLPNGSISLEKVYKGFERSKE